MTSKTTVSELKSTFIEAISSSLEDLQESESIDYDPTVKELKLFKQSEDDQGDEKWIPLEDSTNVDKAGLDQGHVVGVSFEKDGEFWERKVILTKRVRLLTVPMLLFEINQANSVILSSLAQTFQSKIWPKKDP